MTVETLIVGVSGSLGLVIIGWLGITMREWSRTVSANTVQVALLNQKLDYFVEEIESLRSDVDDLKMWRAKTDNQWK